MRWPPVASPTSVQEGGTSGAQEGDLEVQNCSRLCEHGQVSEAVDALKFLEQRGSHVPNNLFYLLLKRCTAKKDLVLGRCVHDLTVQSGYEGNAFLATHLISLYASHGRLGEAMRVFFKVTSPSAHNWSGIIFAYARHGEPTQAIRLYRRMLKSTCEPDNRIFVAVLNACATAGDLAAGRDVHAHVLASAAKPDIFVQNCLVDMYAKCRSLEDARLVFDKLPHKDVVTWNAMIAGYAQQGLGHKALDLYGSMQQEGITVPNSFTFACLLQACVSVGEAALQQGKKLHAQMEELAVEVDVVVCNSLVNMYAKCGSLKDAHSVFNRLPNRDVVTWTTLIAGYVQQGFCQEALSIYSCMQQECITRPNGITFVCLLQACATVEDLPLGKQLHLQIEEQGLQDDVVVGASLVSMYMKCGSLANAQRVFERLSDRDVVTWTAMITGYAQHGMDQEALSLYTTMQQEGIALPNAVTYVCLLQACATVGALPLGKQLHAHIQERGLQADVDVGKSLVNMYARCGSMAQSRQVFDSLPERDIVAWSALIAGYTHQGESVIVFDLVARMIDEGINPNSITFLSLLTVCSHQGLVDKGQKYFDAMSRDYSITPTIEHYTCMVGLLGRAGQLDEAIGMVKSMPFQPDAAVWLNLLGACQKWSNIEVGRRAFEFAVMLNEQDASPYVLMSNIYASVEMWEEAKEMQARRVKSGACKQPGQTWWTDMDGSEHVFVVGDRNHP